MWVAGIVCTAVRTGIVGTAVRTAKNIEPVCTATPCIMSVRNFFRVIKLGSY
jgi:hypothetical protein